MTQATSAPRVPEGLAARYPPGRVIGRGSFGVVYEVAGAPGRAVKVMAGDLDRPRIARELEASRAVRHPNLVPVYDAGFVGDVAYLVMPRADGSFADWAAGRGRDEVGGALRGVAEGLAALHQAGLIHRDLKPENVLMRGETPLLADLGLTKGGELGTLTATGYVLGTPRYMAPEAARGEKLTPAADVFALGVMMYQAWRGGLPHGVDGVGALLRDLAAGGPGREPGRLGPCPPLVRACLASDPAARPTAAAVADALRDPAAVLETDRFAAAGGPGSPPPAAVAPPAVAAVAGGAAPRRVAAVAGLVTFGVVLGVAADRALAPAARGPAPPRPPAFAPPDRRAADPEPGWPKGLGPGFGTRVTRELAAARTPRMAAADGVTDGALSGDPADFAAVVEALPALGTWRDWLADGGRPEGLSGRARGILEAADRAFEAQGLPAPFAPWAGIRPAGGDPRTFLLPDPSRPERDAPVVLRGWAAAFAATARRLGDLTAAFDRAGYEYFSGRGGAFPAAALGIRGPAHFGLVFKDPRLASKSLDRLVGTPARRAAFRPEVREQGILLARLCHLAARAVRADPPAADRVIEWFDHFLQLARPGRYAGYLTLPVATLAGPADSAEARVVHAAIATHRRHLADDFARGREAALAAERAAWEAVRTGPDAGALRGRLFTSRVVYNSLLRPGRAEGHAAWRARVDAAAGWMSDVNPLHRYLLLRESARRLLAADGPPDADAARRYRAGLVALRDRIRDGHRDRLEELVVRLEVAGRE